ncbi:MAG: hypothetical protein ACOY4U_10625 [Pseudomonadota bacterium]
MPVTKSTVTITSANPGVVSWTAHGLPAGTPIGFTTTGALPTNLKAMDTAPGGINYVASAGLATDSFQVTTSPGGGGASIDTTAGTQSGTHTCQLITGMAMPDAATNPILGSGTVTVSNVPLPSVVNITVQDEAGNTLSGYEWRVYVTDPAAGIIGTTELAGEENAAAGIKSATIPAWAAGQATIQVIKGGYVEAVIPVILESGARVPVTVRLESDLNI